METIADIANSLYRIDEIVTKAGLQKVVEGVNLHATMVGINGELLIPEWLANNPIAKEWITILESVLPKSLAENSDYKVIDGSIVNIPYSADGNKLLHILSLFPDAKLHICYAVNILETLQKNNLSNNQLTQLAKHTLHTIVPLMRAYEIPELIEALEHYALKALNPERSLEVQTIKQSLFGNVDINAEETKIRKLLASTFSDINHTLEIRTKGDFSIYKKVLEGRSLHDVIGARIILNDEALDTLSPAELSYYITTNLLPRLVDLEGYSYILEPQDNTLLNIRDDGNFRVIKLTCEKPGSIPFELHITTKKYYDQNRRRHRAFKFVDHDFKRIGLDEIGTYVMGDYAIYLLDQAKGNESKFLYDNTQETINRIRDSIPISTARGNHTIFVPKVDAFKDQIVHLVTEIGSRLLRFAVSTRVHTSSNEMNYMLDMKTHDISVLTGYLWTNIKDLEISEPLKPYAQCEIIDKNNHTILTFNDVLNILLSGDKPEEEAEILRQYPLLKKHLSSFKDQINLLKIKMILIYKNLTQLSYEAKDARLQKQDEKLIIEQELQKLIQKLKNLMLRFETLERIKNSESTILQKGEERSMILNVLAVESFPSELLNLLTKLLSEDETIWKGFLNLDKVVENPEDFQRYIRIFLNLPEDSQIYTRIRKELVEALRAEKNRISNSKRDKIRNVFDTYKSNEARINSILESVKSEIES